MYKVTGYLKIQHFKDLLPDNTRLTRLSHNAVSYDYISSIGHNIVGIVYVNTIVAELNRNTGQIILNSGGYKTVTTKKYMNIFLSRFYGNCYVYQKNYNWFVNICDKITTFDGMIVKFM